MSAKFTQVETHTTPKCEVEHGWRDPAMDLLPLRDGLAVTMVGHVNGLMAHIDELEQKNIPQEDIIIVDYAKPVADALKAEVKRLGLKCHVVHEDYFTVLKLILEDGHIVKFADFDGTANISQYHRDLVHLHAIFPNQIECMSICAATRSPTGSTDIEGLVQYITDQIGLSCIARGYVNRGPMVSILLSAYPIQYQLPDEPLAARIHRLLMQGLTQRRIASMLGIDRNVVQQLPKKHPITFTPIQPC